MVGNTAVVLAVLLLTTGGEALRKAKRAVNPAECAGRADVVFVLDSSNSVGQGNFDREVNFVSSAIQGMNIGPDAMQVAMTTFAGQPSAQFYLNTFSNSADIMAALTKVTYTGGQGDTAAAIKDAHQNALSPVRGGRTDDVPKVIVLVTSGNEGDKDVARLLAQVAKDDGVRIYTVGVTSAIDATQLREISSNPDSRYYLTADNYHSLASLADSIALRTCNEIPEKTVSLPPAQSCLRAADVSMVLDASTTVGAENFQKAEDFFKHLTMNMNVAPNAVRTSVLQYSGYPSLELQLGAASSRQDVLKALDAMQYQGGGTDTPSAVNYVTNNVLSVVAGARGNVPRVMVLVTDGTTTDDATSMKTAVERAKQAGISTIAIGVGPRVSKSDLELIAGGPQGVISVNSYDQLKQIQPQVEHLMCGVQAFAPQTGPGGVTLAPCEDKIDNCDAYGTQACVDYQPWAKANCNAYCGFCIGGPTKPPPPCVDALSTCPNYTQEVCTAYAPWAEKNCRRYCGFCDGGFSSIGFFGQCFYKGQPYKQGESWDDGCDYRCTCEDGQTGKYRCYNKCPIYHDLPPVCTLVNQPGECCLKPLCDFQQTVTTTEGSGKGSKNGLDACLYKGNAYYQDQQWQDGCDVTCYCTDASKGVYKCQSLCPTYSQVPQDCHMVREAGQCCATPRCEFSSQTGSFTGYGSVTGDGGNERPTNPPPCADLLDNCAVYGADKCTSFSAWAHKNCRKFCNFCGTTEVAGSEDRCLFGGRTYSQGQVWRPDCGTQCVCENAVHGYYRCYSTCPEYSNLPKGCSIQQRSGECCRTVECVSGLFVPATTNLNSIGNGYAFSSGGKTVLPTIPPSGSFGGISVPTLQGCLYKGTVYVQGQRWNDGCQKSCICQDQKSGMYKCTDRCPTYASLPAGCHMVVDPLESCCQTPQCPSGAVIQPPSYGQVTTGVGQVAPPSIKDLYTGHGYISMQQTGSTVPPPTGGSGAVGGMGYCTYKGQRYLRGQQWEDGCDYNCVCDDARFGHFTCTDKCVKYTNLPQPFCYLVQDPNNPCCQIPHCNFTAPYFHFTGMASLNPTTANPTQGTVPPTPGIDACVYKGSHYDQGQTWYDGCSLMCSCDDSKQNISRCNTRCNEYTNVDPTCTLIPDPDDPACCKVPSCPSKNTGTGSVSGPTSQPTIPPLPTGSVIGSATGPGNLVPKGVCVYKGQQYKQGQTWQDGCQYNCVCEDEDQGQYKCTEKCKRFPPLPAQCRLVSDFADPCCQVPRCDFPPSVNQIGGQGNLTPTPGTLPPGHTPVPKIGYCEYKGNQYSQGQQWKDGCDYLCRCDDADTGVYVCGDRCPSFGALPSYCKLATDPKDSCCLAPQCSSPPNPTPGPNPTGGVPTPGNNPTQSGASPGLPGVNTPTAGTGPTTPSGQTPTPQPFTIPTLPPAKIVATAGVPTPSAGPGGLTPTRPALNYCQYKANQYQQGQRWDDGCDYTCECVDALNGKYECTDKCPRYPPLPANCVMVKDLTNPCCQKPVCDQVTPSPGTPGNPGGVPTVGPNGQTATPTPGNPQGGTNATPGLHPQASPSPGNPTQNHTPVPRNVCVYKGQTYTQGQTWYDGCDYICDCENSEQGLYRCNNRCPTYDSLPAGCTLKADPSDPFCCKLPDCPLPPSVTNQTGYVSIPTIPPGSFQGGVATPTPPTPGPSPSPGPDGKTAVPTPQPTTVNPPVIGTCVYKGQTYTTGQRWQDGCDFDCVCEDGTTGRYKCDEKCARYPPLPANCRMVQDFADPCCQKPYCDKPTPGLNTPAPTPTPSLGPTQPQVGPTLVQHNTPTPAPPDVCLYNGVPFTQGQSWKDGCDLTCVCEDAKSNYYRCSQRCPVFDLPQGCTLNTDPRDSCCHVPNCPPVIPTQSPPLPNGQTPSPGTPTDASHASPTPYPQPTNGPPGIINGQGSVVPGGPKGCLYNGILYKSGQTWQDGCKLMCQCLDDMTGAYKCVERCPLFNNLPTYCRLVVDSRDPCCKVPECTTPGPHLNPIPSPTPGQLNPGHTDTPTLGPFNTPTTQLPFVPQTQEVCVYKGRTYTTGQTWDDGCSKRCVCEDGKTGFFRCSERCAVYPNLPVTCTLVADPQDPTCCKAPQCIQQPGVNGVPTPNPSAPPTVITNPPGVVTGSGRVPTPQPSAGAPQPTHQPGCLYKGKVYVQGQQWQDGCQFNCECLNEMTGQYKCEERCAKYPQLPPQCQLQPDPKDFCCYVSVCDFNKPIPTPGQPLTNPTGIPTLPGGGPIPTAGTPPPTGGVPTAQPQPIPTFSIPPQPSTPNPRFVFCVYNGATFAQGQTWQDGCSQTCRCEDAMRNYYTCFDRCPSYKLSPGCTLVTDPQDPCCQVPQCSVTPAPLTPSPGVPGQPTPGVPGSSPTPQPSPIPTAVTGVIIGGVPTNSPIRTPQPGQPSFCEYKGQQFKTGNKWNDGCDYQCECLDDMTGQYKCNERCPRYVNIPSYCVLVDDPKDSCCKTPYCPGVATPVPPTGPPTPSPSPGTGPHTPGVPNPSNNPSPTPAVNTPPSPVTKDVCVYNGKAYSQGQRWYDGCDKVCVCENGMTGYYTCNPRCPTYQNMAPNCIMVPDPKDPTCCLAPQCDGPDNKHPSGVVGTITGNGMPTPALPTGPTPSLGPGQTPPPTQPLPQLCVYKGQQFQTGQRWADGCDYMCECVDGMTGQYKCTDRCPRFPNLPPTCHLERDSSDPCCEKPVCDSNPTAPPGASLPPTPYPSAPPTTQYCVYQGVPFRQGQSWQVGCDKVCRCEDASMRQINCDDRCPTFPKVPAGCTLAVDPNDQCCQVLNCPLTLNPDMTLTPHHGVISGQSVPPDNPNPQINGVRNACVYMGRSYQQGQTWDDGCTYTCECIDSSTGRYKCTEKCTRWPPLPTTCTMIQDPKDRCCQVPYCPSLATPGPVPTGPGGVTLVPTIPSGPSPTTGTPGQTPVTKHACVYKGRTYQQSQQWYDGCDRVCRCEDADMNVFRCQERCADYAKPPANCIMVPDPSDPTCCLVPQCPLNPTGTPPNVGFVPFPTPVLGTVTGQMPVPTLPPFVSPSPGATRPPQQPGCYYQGKAYRQGQSWADGCDFQCVCLNENTGQYKCTEKCSKFPNLPNKCVLLPDPKDSCCKAPYCDFVNPTPFPSGLPTPPPGSINVTPQSGTPFPGTSDGYCVYQGVYYTRGQTWKVGCGKTCVCEDPQTGYYTCRDRCPTFPNLPTSCVMKVSPDDPCCLVPDCNNLLPPGTNNIPGVTPPTHTGVITPTGVPATFTGIGGSNPRPDGTYGSFGSSSRGGCVYKGVVHMEGRSWDDGCDLKCECLDGTRGVYKCTDKCPNYYYLPPQCYKTQDPADPCCQKAVCDFTPNHTRPPSPTATVQAVTGDMCVYKDGKQYSQGALWSDGCDYDCQCLDAKNNHYNCTQRCRAFSDLPSYCTLEQDPLFPCCKKAVCQGVTGMQGGTAPTASPTLAPDVTNVLPLGTHGVFTGTYRPPQGSSTSTGHSSLCFYKGKTYHQGDTWEDGCDFICQCTEAQTGTYRCTDRCPKYPPVPNNCKYVTVPGLCCPTLSCNVPNHGTYSPSPELTAHSLPTPKPGTTGSNPDKPIYVVTAPQGPITGGSLPGNGTLVPTNTDITGLRGKCVYKNRMYNQGETWTEDCDYNCECLEGNTGYYRCRPMCAKYDDSSLPDDCYLVTSPGACCKTPVCQKPDGSTVSPLDTTIFPVVGAFSGGFTGFRPGITPGSSGGFVGFSPSRCHYKGVDYKQGQKWDDGCDFTCECTDANHREYTCSPKCPSYTSLPKQCRLVKTSGCCEQLDCTQKSNPTQPPNVDPNCQDKLDNCLAYGSYACSDTYRQWALQNCKRTCNLCPTVSTVPDNSNCTDKLDNCVAYGVSACVGKYEPWARQNCKRTCNYCHEVTAPPATQPSIPGCLDLLPNCDKYGESSCKPPYDKWAKINCNKTCNLCSGVINANTSGFSQGSHPFQPITGNSSFIGKVSTQDGYVLLLKGVAGVPGDLLDLWKSPRTENANNTLAWDLTNKFKGHFKPDLSNKWSECKFDKVKLAVFNNGEEKASVVFDAKGTDKNSWFDPSRIIDSTYTDIKTAAHDLFALQDGQGHQFSVASSGNNCNLFGWIMVVTRQNCFYENENQFPAFLYSTSPTRAHFGFTSDEGFANVIAILGQGGNCGVNQPKLDKCEYKGKEYGQDKNWQDGCDYNCTCKDASISYYECKNLCPVYQTVPNNCHLVKPPGSCCSQVSCGTGSHCYYKGQTYQQDETWMDNCDYMCECIDASRGFYQCSTMCPTWNLPSECHLDRAPTGKCCPVPKCPQGFTINWPPGYSPR